LKGPGDGAAGLKKGLGMPPMAKKSLGDGVAKKGFPSPPLPMKKAEPLAMKGQSPEASADVNEDSFIGKSPEVLTASVTVSDDDVTLDFADSDSSVSSWSSTPDKELGKGAAFLPQFAPPPIRGEPADPNDFSWLEAAEAKDLDALAAADDARSSNDDGPMKEVRRQSQSKEPTKLWSGESFLGTSSSRVYGLGSVRSSGSSGEKGKEVRKGKSNEVTSENEATGPWASEDLADAARLIDEMNDAGEVDESLISQKDLIPGEKANTAALLSDTEEKLSTQLDKFEEERQILRDDKARAEVERSEADQRIQEIELARMKAEKEAEELQQRFAEEKAALSAKLTEAVRTRTDDEKRLIDEKAKVAALITEAERKLALQLEKFEEERLKMNEEKKMASAKIEEANSARMKAEEDAKTLETVLSEQKLKQEKWMEEQTLLIERMLEKRIAAEKSKIEAALTEAKEKEEARLTEEQNRLVEEQLEKRLAEEKSKLSAEITAAEEKIRRELDNLESERDAQEEKVTKEEKAQDQVLDIPRPEAGEIIPDDELRLPTLTTTPSDALAADVEALELISMCEAEYDSNTPTKSSPPSADSCLIPSDYPFVSLLRDSSPYIVNHRHSTIVYHIPGDLISDVEKFNSVMDDIALTWLFGMKIVLCVGCRTQVSQRLDTLQGVRSKYTAGIRITSTEALRVLEEEAGFCRFEVERQLNRCLRNKGADCNVVSGCFITAKKFGVVDGVDYQQTGYPTTLQTDRINRFLSRSDVVLLTPLGFTGEGHAVNIKSEQLAGFTAGALKASKVVYFSTKPLVMRGSSENDRDANGNQRIQMIQRSSVLQILSHHGLKIHSKTGFPLWRNESRVAATNRDVQDMLLKMGWATDAIDKGVERAHIIACDDGALLEELFTARRGYGTCISQDDYEAPHPEDQNDDLIADEVGAGMIEW
jgi:amino-acid N-acetyltransferase